MSLGTPVLVKILSGVLASAVVVTGGVAVQRGGGDSSSHRTDVSAGGKGAEARVDDTEVVIDPVTGARRVVKAAGGEAKDAAQREGSAGISANGVSAGVQAGPLSGGKGVPVSAGASVKPGGIPVVGGGGSGGSGSGGPGSGPAVGAPSVPLGVPVVAAPSTPGTSTYNQGTYQVVVPGLAGASKKLCLSGTLANKCQTVTVPAAKAMTLTVSYSSNTGSKPPTLTPSRCEGGLSVTVANLAQGAEISVSTEGAELSGEVATSEVTQTASLCDA